MAGAELPKPDLKLVDSANVVISMESTVSKSIYLQATLLRNGVLVPLVTEEHNLNSGNNIIKTTLNNLDFTMDDNNQLFISLVDVNNTMYPIYPVSDKTISWDNLKLGGGGYVTGIVAHPKFNNVVYARSDVGGLFKLTADGHWEQMLEKTDYEDMNLYGVDSIGLDPNDPKVIYIIAGKFDKSLPCDILKSADVGVSWIRTNFNQSSTSLGPYKWSGESIIVDPNDSNTVFVITSNNGLWVSKNAGVTWEKVSGFSSSAVGRVVTYNKQYDKIYVASYGDTGGIYESTNGGVSWSYMTGSPKKVARIDFDNAGNIYTAGEEGVFKYKDNVWTDITPNHTFTAYAGVSISQQNPNRLITLSKKNSLDSYNNHVYISDNNGVTWTDLYSKFTYQYYAGWDEARARKISAPSTIIFNPFDDKQVFISDWYGVWKTDNIFGNTILWKKSVEGIENMVGFGFACPPAKTRVFAGVADNDGFVFKNTEDIPTNTIDTRNIMQHSTSIDFCQRNPDILVRVGGDASKSSGYYSLNNGVSWTLMNSFPKKTDGTSVGSVGGKVAISADVNSNGIPTIVVISDNSKINYSLDYGNSWIESTSSITNATGGGTFWNWGRQIAADRVNKNVFYTFRSGNFYRSTDGAASFQLTYAFPHMNNWNNDEVRIYTSPQDAGTVWFLKENDFIYKSTDFGSTFVKVNGFTQQLAMCFGKNSIGNPNPTVYVYGERNSIWGIYMSLDMGENWVCINDDDHKITNQPKNLEGDKQEFGSIYISTNGAGLFYGQSIIK